MRKFKWQTVVNVLFIVLLLVIVLVPDAKAAFLNGLMKIGLFNPDIEVITEAKQSNTIEITFRDGEGKTVSLSELKGKVIFINFWATWCPPCRAEMPSINTLHKKFYGNNSIVFITVDADGKYAKAKKFLDRKKYSFPLYTVASDIPSQLFSGSLPTTVVIDKKGKIVFRHEGLADYSDKKFTEFLETQIQQ